MMKAHHPITHLLYYFIDKCLPFGSSISCAHFQLFSDALAAILEAKMKVRVTNYLDDFLFMSISEYETNRLVGEFLLICERLGVPVSSEKTELATSCIVFLGILLDGKNHILAIPQEKTTKAINLLKLVISLKKVTIHVVQKLAGLLNFLQCAIILGKTFMQAMYDKLKLLDNEGRPVKQYHHIKVDASFRQDCRMWLDFLVHSQHGQSHQANLCRPFTDLDKFHYAHTLNFCTDASKNKLLGFGAVFGDRWLYGRWDQDFVEENDPSIEYLELYALCAGILTWGHLLTDTKIIIFCDNEAVVHIVNNLTSKCP